ncbi:glycosyltransferase family 1 protein [Leifsonia sp. NPDC080035]|uniref:Glycosyltransferase family 1 protein n=1 Tax=Leifsonia sp. NPDC080035 TaxID=3143936 RepID=A0AAU7GG79_9MICO
MSARILILSFSTLVSDPRVQKQIALFEGAYDVVTCGYGPAPEGVVQHYRIPDERVYWRYPRLAVMLRQWRRAYRDNPAVSWVRENLPVGDVDVIVANDVDAAGAAAALKPRRGFHADLHEYAPLQNSELLRFRLFVAPFLSWQIRTFVRRAASTSTVCQSLADKYRTVFGLSPAVVMNAPPFAELAVQPVGETIRLVHAGAALRNRRLEILIDAVAQVDAPVTLDFYLAPNDPGYLDSLKERASGVERIRFHEPVPFTELVPTLNTYDVGLHILAPTNFNNAYALPNKFFEYVQARLGLIIGPSPEMVRILGERGLGAVTADFTAEALADVLRGIDRATVEQWKRDSDAAARDLSAETQTPVWAAAVDRIATGAVAS